MGELGSSWIHQELAMCFGYEKRGNSLVEFTKLVASKLSRTVCHREGSAASTILGLYDLIATELDTVDEGSPVL